MLLPEYSTILLVYDFPLLLRYDSTTLLLDYCTTLLLYVFTTRLFGYSITLLLYSCTSLLLYEFNPLLLDYSITLLLYDSTTLRLSYSRIDSTITIHINSHMNEPPTLITPSTSPASKARKSSR